MFLFYFMSARSHWWGSFNRWWT